MHQAILPKRHTRPTQTSKQFTTAFATYCRIPSAPQTRDSWLSLRTCPSACSLSTCEVQRRCRRARCRAASSNSPVDNSPPASTKTQGIWDAFPPSRLVTVGSSLQQTYGSCQDFFDLVQGLECLAQAGQQPPAAWLDLLTQHVAITWQDAAFLDEFISMLRSMLAWGYHLQAPWLHGIDMGCCSCSNSPSTFTLTLPYDSCLVVLEAMSACPDVHEPYSFPLLLEAACLAEGAVEVNASISIQLEWPCSSAQRAQLLHAVDQYHAALQARSGWNDSHSHESQQGAGGQGTGGHSRRANAQMFRVLMSSCTALPMVLPVLQRYSHGADITDLCQAADRVMSDWEAAYVLDCYQRPSLASVRAQHTIALALAESRHQVLGDCSTSPDHSKDVERCEGGGGDDAMGDRESQQQGLSIELPPPPATAGSFWRRAAGAEAAAMGQSSSGRAGAELERSDGAASVDEALLLLMLMCLDTLRYGQLAGLNSRHNALQRQALECLVESAGRAAAWRAMKDDIALRQVDILCRHADSDIQLLAVCIQLLAWHPSLKYEGPGIVIKLLNRDLSLFSDRQLFAVVRALGRLEGGEGAEKEDETGDRAKTNWWGASSAADRGGSGGGDDLMTRIGYRLGQGLLGMSIQEQQQVMDRLGMAVGLEGQDTG